MLPSIRWTHVLWHKGMWLRPRDAHHRCPCHCLYLKYCNVVTLLSSNSWHAETTSLMTIHDSFNDFHFLQNTNYNNYTSSSLIFKLQNHLPKKNDPFHSTSSAEDAEHTISHKSTSKASPPWEASVKQWNNGSQRDKMINQPEDTAFFALV